MSDRSAAPYLQRAVRAALTAAVEAYADEPEIRTDLRTHLDRLDEPLRIAIAGKIKAGKSTLLNALVGEQIAPTDAGECTKVITWYQFSRVPRVRLQLVGKSPRLLPVHRDNGRLALGLDGAAPEDVDRLTVEWPSRNLSTATLIDTPGIDSLSTTISNRTVEFLTPDAEPSAADAIVYLLRHLHATDLSFLESFHDRAAGHASVVNAVGVLSRADEIGAGRLDALISARRVAARYSEDPTIRQLCQTVVPVAGLLAETGKTLRQDEYWALDELADEPKAVTDDLLLSVDRFVRATAPVKTPADTRSALLARLGLFGVRLSLALLRGGYRDSTVLAGELVRRSGLDEVRKLLATQFTDRRDLLKARTALLAVAQVVSEHPRAGSEDLADAVERIFAGAHEFRELALLQTLRSPQVGLVENDRADAERFIGGSGTSLAARSGLSPNATDEDVRAIALDGVRRFRLLAENPLADRATAEVCQQVARSCEGMLAELAR